MLGKIRKFGIGGKKGRLFHIEVVHPIHRNWNDLVGDCKEILGPSGSSNRIRGCEMEEEDEIALGRRPTVQMRTDLRCRAECRT